MAQLSDDELRRIAERAYLAFRSYPNVHAVSIGPRERGGREIDELAITVFVTRKLAPSALAAGAMIPAEFEGLPTDVIEMPRPQLLGAMDEIPGIDADSKPEDTRRERPLKGGLQISGDAKTRSYGTLGLLTKVQGDTRIMAVTNWHVLFDNNNSPSSGLRVGNPDSSDGCTRCARGSFGTLVSQDYTTIDAAIARLDPDMQWLAEIQCIGFVRGWGSVPVTTPASPPTYKVRKYGRTTRLTGGTVRRFPYVSTATGSDVPDRHYTNGILIQPNRPLGGDQAKFADQGDSGSAVVNVDNEVVGVLFAAVLDKTASFYGYGIAFPINDLVSKFQAQNTITLIPATATRTGDVQTTPSASAAVDEAARAAAETAALAHRLERELSSSEPGRQVAELWLRHSYELSRLVNRNKKVGALWQRHGGPALFQHAIRAARLRDHAIPSEIAGRPVDDCVDGLVEVFLRYGSDALRADLHAHRAAFPAIGGRSYDEILETLRQQERR